jgi:PAS domain S-box-containing protein
MVEEIAVSQREFAKRCEIFAMIRILVALILILIRIAFPSLWRCSWSPFGSSSPISEAILWLYLIIGILLYILIKSFRRKKLLAQSALGVDLIATTIIVGLTGGAQSQFVILYMLFIVGSAIMLSTLSGLAVAIASAAFLGILHLGNALRWWLLCPIPGAGQTQTFQFVAVLSFLVLTGFLSGFLALRGSRLKLLNVELLESLNAGIVIVDLDGTVQYLNRRGAQLAKVNQYRSRGERIESVLSTPLGSLIRESLRSRETKSRCETQLRTDDDQPIPIGITTSILHDRSGGVWGVLGTFVDLTDAKRIEERLRHADRMSTIAHLAAGMAHEIRNPLSCIMGAIELLDDLLTDKKELAEVSDIIIRESQRLSAIVENFLDLSRLESPRCSIFHINTLWDEVMSVMNTRYRSLLETSVELKLKYEPEDLTLNADLGQMRQVLLNLLINAIEAFSPGGGHIVTTAVKERRDGNEGIRIIVSDDGPGIPEEYRPNLFDPFFTSKARGTGMGLAVVKKIIEGHGGDVELAESNEGSTFQIWIPVQADIGNDKEA